MVENGEISVNQFVYRTRPILEKSEFEGNNIIRQNIRNIKNYSTKTPKGDDLGTNIFDAEAVIKRKKRMQKIKQVCKLFDKKVSDPTAGSS